MRKQDTKKAFQDTKTYFLKCSPQRFCTLATPVKQSNILKCRSIRDLSGLYIKVHATFLENIVEGSYQSQE